MQACQPWAPTAPLPFTAPHMVLQCWFSRGLLAPHHPDQALPPGPSHLLCLHTPPPPPPPPHLLVQTINMILNLSLMCSKLFVAHKLAFFSQCSPFTLRFILFSSTLFVLLFFKPFCPVKQLSTAIGHSHISMLSRCLLIINNIELIYTI